MITVTYSRARENLGVVLDQAIAGEPVEITRRNNESAIVISKASFEEYCKAMLNAEFSQLIGQFDVTNKQLTDK
ncbi:MULTISPECIES: type II toxin-antitoxin system Phd/YefM family antitoxin [Photorhabdus]|uniref:Antitoxin n=1 Tax=Photorhabdus thracensis TaxID=230089 RepID=A0A0F7LU78_9GAMM|nr:type II toxin-antitoxin system prevent-host-death family antitoxin [Photorhabdus thracensis]AKH65441.1 antitoxin [Photorhabdus thracensis]MCC8422861.1 type II toxin-antitoxin system Phd/YefM family antitoxin [Photorhabdus thracensis]